MSAFRILVADDHPIFRLGLCALLRSHAGWEVCGEADDGRDAVEKHAQLRPDLVILDISMPTLNGVDAARQILKVNPDQRILVLTDVHSEQVVHDCLEAGVRGWVFKLDQANELTIAVEAMQQHRSTFSSAICDVVLETYLQKRRVRRVNTKLSVREREVVQLIAEGKTTKEIAALLCISPKTADTHRSNILLKLDLHCVADLVLYAVRNEIIHLQLPSELLFNTSWTAQPTDGMRRRKEDREAAGTLAARPSETQPALAIRAS
jgi:DNA-binding NarL/FixJ family response regulator